MKFTPCTRDRLGRKASAVLLELSCAEQGDHKLEAGLKQDDVMVTVNLLCIQYSEI